MLDPPYRMVQTWHTLYDAELAAEPVSQVEWVVEDAGEGLTRLRVVHGDLAQSPQTWANVRHGWVWILDGLKTLLETGSPLPPATDEPDRPDDVSGDWHRMEAIEANNSVWELIEKDDRSAADDEEMLQRAYAARYHWARATGRGPINVARGAWLVAEVQRLVGEPRLSLRYAEECLALCEEHGFGDADLDAGPRDPGPGHRCPHAATTRHPPHGPPRTPYRSRTRRTGSSLPTSPSDPDPGRHTNWSYSGQLV